VKAVLDSRRAIRGVLAGLLTAWVALGVAQLVAGLSRPQGSPVAAVGSVAIDNAPPAVKNFAISTFGSHDKLALVIGILVILAVFSAAIGVLAMHRLSYGFAGLGVFALIGVLAALDQPKASPVDVLPTLIGAAVGAYTLYLLVRTAGGLPSRTTAYQAPASPATGRGRAGTTAPAFDVPADPALAHPAPADPAPADPAAADAAAPEPAPAEPTPVAPAPAGAQVGGAVPASATPAGPPASWQPGRRGFLTASAIALAAGGIGVYAGRTLSERSNVSAARASVRFPRPAHPAPPLPPGTDFDINGLSPFSTPNASFYRVDTALILPQVAPQTWRLRIHGMVEREINVSFDELLRRPLIENWMTLCCVSNPVAGPYIGNAKWLGASLASLLRTARPRAGADQLLCTSTDGFTSGTPIATVLDGRDALLAVAMNGTALPVAHGFPVRMVVPGLYGYVSATKWVTDIKVTTYAAEPAYWAQRGWSQQAPIKTESRIDVPNGPVKAGRTPVAGVAWAQHKGIDAVHVRVDRGPWEQAKLAAVPGIDTWRQWVWEWDATGGSHVIEARATDATGYTQTAQQEPPEPNGASGYPSITVNVS
jgi:DMSO/TMAO reductase YedYZ molybdopterin-dependent catalytic subunit